MEINSALFRFFRDMEVQRGVRVRGRKYHRLSLYTDPPSPDLSLEMVLRAVHDRMRCLQSFGRPLVPTDLLNTFPPSIGQRMAEEVFHRDQSSHFMLRAICSDSDEHFQWFLENEIKLLDFKVGQESVMSLLSFCNRFSLKLHKVDGEE